MGYTLEPIEEDDVNLQGKFGMPGASKDSKDMTGSSQVRREAPKITEKPIKENPEDLSESRELSDSIGSGEGREVAEKYKNMLEQIQATSTTSDDDDDDDEKSKKKRQTALVDDIAQAEETVRVERLIEVARKRGPTEAFEVALKLGDYYTMDTLHDTLIENFYDELVKNGFVKT